MKWYEDPIYIKMCEKAEEIQEIRKPLGEKRIMTIPLWKDGDYLGWKNPITGKYNGWAYNHICEKGFDCIWLPTQSQLQEMAVKDDVLPWTLIRRFFKWTLEIYTHDFGKTSMEQLWLAFVMKEKYNKTWNGENWICIKK